MRIAFLFCFCCLFFLFFSSVDSASFVFKKQARTFLSSSLVALNLLGLPTPSTAANDPYGSEPPLPTTCQSDSNPSLTTQTCRRVGLTKENRLLGCLANENCFSSSSTSTKYTSPWLYSESLTAEQTLSILKVAAAENGLKVLKEQTTPGNYYLLAAERDVPKQAPGSSLFYEFLLKPDDHIVLIRAFVDKTVFVYPLQQPVSDQGALEGKLKAIREKTGQWKTKEHTCTLPRSNPPSNYPSFHSPSSILQLT